MFSFSFFLQMDSLCAWAGERGSVVFHQESFFPASQHLKRTYTKYESCVLVLVVYLTVCMVDIEQPPFEVTETGWGEFSVPIKVYFHDAREAPVSLTHNLKLFLENGASTVPRKPGSLPVCSSSLPCIMKIRS